MDNQHLPLCSLIEEIKHNSSKDKDNTYYKDSKTKSRVPVAWPTESDIEGSVATERATIQTDKNLPQHSSGNYFQPVHKRKQSANIPYKMTMPHTNISRL